jgi:hypothetical protein
METTKIAVGAIPQTYASPYIAPPPPYSNVLGTAARSKTSLQDILTPRSFSVSEMTANFKFYCSFNSIPTS